MPHNPTPNTCIGFTRHLSKCSSKVVQPSTHARCTGLFCRTLVTSSTPAPGLRRTRVSNSPHWHTGGQGTAFQKVVRHGGHLEALDSGQQVRTPGGVKGFRRRRPKAAVAPSAPRATADGGVGGARLQLARPDTKADTACRLACIRSGKEVPGWSGQDVHSCPHWSAVADSSRGRMTS